MKKFIYIILLIFTFNSTLANEPFVVLEYKGAFNNENMNNIDSNNKFLKDNSYSTTHKIKFGESESTSFLKIPNRTFVPPRSQARKFIYSKLLCSSFFLY